MDGGEAAARQGVRSKRCWSSTWTTRRESKMAALLVQCSCSPSPDAETVLTSLLLNATLCKAKSGM